MIIAFVFLMPKSVSYPNHIQLVVQFVAGNVYCCLLILLIVEHEKGSIIIVYDIP